jgi:hypothetical protein
LKELEDGPYSSFILEIGRKCEKKFKQDKQVHCTNSVFVEVLQVPPHIAHIILKFIIQFPDFLVTPQKIAHFQKLKPNKILPALKFF